MFYLLGGMCGPERMFLRHERRLALASPSLSISLTAPLHDGECLTVPEDKGGSRDTLDDQIGERERNRRGATRGYSSNQGPVKVTDETASAHHRSLLLLYIHMIRSPCCLFSVFPVVPSCTTGCGELFQLQVPTFHRHLYICC